LFEGKAGSSPNGADCSIESVAPQTRRKGIGGGGVMGCQGRGPSQQFGGSRAPGQSTAVGGYARYLGRGRPPPRVALGLKNGAGHDACTAKEGRRGSVAVRFCGRVAGRRRPKSESSVSAADRSNLESPCPQSLPTMPPPSWLGSSMNYHSYHLIKPSIQAKQLQQKSGGQRKRPTHTRFKIHDIWPLVLSQKKSV